MARPSTEESRVSMQDAVGLYGEQYGNFGDSNLEDLQKDNITASEVRLQIEEMRQSIFHDWKSLQGILACHEEKIYRRWMKMTKVRRTRVLLEAWPDMAATHRPDFATWRGVSTDKSPEFAAKFRETCLFPHINLEDLAKPRSLLLFLKSRADNAPHTFAMADGKVVHFGRAIEAISRTFLGKHTMIFTGRTDVSRYGELVAWRDNWDAPTWLDTGKGVRPGHGLLILEVQQQTMRFLVDCCKAILHDIPANALTTGGQLIHQSLPLDGETADGFAVRAILAAEACYRAPASLDLASLETVFAARVLVAEDHITSLREDPSYFTQALYECKEHRPEMIEWKGTTPDPLAKTLPDLWQEVIKAVVTDAYMLLGTWKELLEQLRDVQSLQKKYAPEISVDKELPTEYLIALLKFRFCLNQSARGPLGILRIGVAASPPLRSRFQRLPTTDDKRKVAMFERGANANEADGKLLWLLRFLRDNEHDRKMMRVIALPSLVDELERIVRVDDKARVLLSDYVAAAIGDLAILCEGMRQLHLYEPWASTFHKVSMFTRHDIVVDFDRRVRDLDLPMRILEGRTLAQIGRLGDPGDNKFYYPCDKRRTKEVFDLMRVAEKNLDTLWAAIDLGFQASAGDKMNAHPLKDSFAQPKILHRTLEWTEPQRGRKSDVKKISKLSLAELSFELQHLTEQTIDQGRATPKTKKKKTRGTPGIMQQDPQETDTEPAALQQAVSGPSEVRLAVDARALKVFRILFHEPSSDGEPGFVAWKDFLHAMVSAGFAPEKSYGSVWHFAPVDDDFARSIQFHEPHPDGKLQYFQARRIGRRLTRAYGWTGETFKLKEKVRDGV